MPSPDEGAAGARPQRPQRPQQTPRGPEFDPLPEPEPAAVAHRRDDQPAEAGRSGGSGRLAGLRERIPRRIPARQGNRQRGRGPGWRIRIRSLRGHGLTRATKIYIIVVLVAALISLAALAAVGFTYDEGVVYGFPFLLVTSPWWLPFLVVDPSGWPGPVPLLLLLVGAVINAVLINRYTHDALPPGRHPDARESLTPHTPDGRPE